MPIIDDFSDEKNISTVIKRDAITLLNGQTTNAESIIATVLSIFYIGSQAESLVGEKLRQTVDGVSIMDFGTDIKLNDTLEINSKRYKCINIEDPALRNEFLVIALKGIN